MEVLFIRILIGKNRAQLRTYQFRILQKKFNILVTVSHRSDNRLLGAALARLSKCDKISCEIESQSLWPLSPPLKPGLWKQ